MSDPDPDPDRPLPPEELKRLEGRIDRWLAAQLDDNPSVVAVEREADPDIVRWYVRVTGEAKSVYSVYFELRQRRVHYETYLMPAPEEDHARFFEHLLRRNARLGDLRFWIGEEDAVFLGGTAANRRVDETELDHILGAVYAAIELCFQPALRIGFASRMARSQT